MSGFTKNIRADIARSVVLYMEQEDPLRRHREKVVCAVNLGDFELHYPDDAKQPEATTEDGRTVRRKMWDEAVRTLMIILTENGLNPRYVRNDKNKCRFTVKQDSVEAPEKIPDEFYAMELYYCSEFELEARKLEYVKRIHQFEDQIGECKHAFFSWRTPPSKKILLQQELELLEQEKLFFIGTNPDPREMDSGLIFKIEIYTLKEFGVLKEKIRNLLSRYIEEISYVAAAHGTTISKKVSSAVKELKQVG